MLLFYFKFVCIIYDNISILSKNLFQGGDSYESKVGENVVGGRETEGTF